ncbi:YdcF family protein [Prauserella rugosa]|uniref:YdcF family protein n=1 Tax=Prauserella rugosa TaxID=43354 RepID=UPI0004C449BB|nr:YdcF family protein [Prauserella rugosa]KMS92357.1 membrane protein [Streptomyces regensis]
MTRWIRRAVAGVVLIAVVLVAGTALRVWHVARADERQPADAIVVLGAAQYNGTPSKVFAYRLAQAKELYDEGVAPRIVTTGGRAQGDAYSEAEAGTGWLTENGVPDSDTVTVPEGNDTLLSLEAVAREADRQGWESAVIVSDPWHSLRARTMLEDAGVESWTSPTHSGPIVQTRGTQAWYITRETAALLYYHLLGADSVRS